jgi:hypothetical protein
MHTRLILLLATALTGLDAAAETVYRTVDKDGNVIFSDEPPVDRSNTEEITIDAPPPPADRARESERAAQRAIDQASRDRARRNAASEARTVEYREAEKAVDLAKKDLEEAKVVGPGDRRGKAGGGTRLTIDYLKRVEKAEKKLAEAQQKLDSLE